MGKANKKITYAEVFFMTMILFLPTIFNYYVPVKDAITSFANVIYMIVLFIWFCKGVKTDKWLGMILLFLGTIMLTTAINNGNIRQTAIIWIKLFASLLIIKAFFVKYGTTAFKAMKSALFFLVFVNLISMFLRPEGIVRIGNYVNNWYSYSVPWWVFGYKNSMFPWLFITNLLAQIDLIKNRTENKKNYYNYVIIFSTLLTAFVSESSTTVISLCLLSLYVFLSKLILQFKKVVKMPVILAFYIVLTITLVTASQNIIFEFVSGIFGKDATFTGRTFAWEAALSAIRLNPIVGYGMLDVDAFREMLGAYAFVSAHNTFLQTLMEGGVILLIEFFCFFVILGRKINKIGSNNDKIKILMLWSVLVLCIQMSFEAYTDSLLLWRILTIMFYLLDLTEKEESLA